MTAISRRTLLAGIGGTAILAAGGIAAGMQSGGLPEAMRRVLVRLIGPFEMDDADFARFAADFAAGRDVPSAVEADGLRLAEALGATRTVAGLHPRIGAKVEKFERDLLTDFALATGIDGPPAGRKLSYTGLFKSNACSNPFARLV